MEVGLEELAAHRVDADQPLGAAKVQRLKDLDDRPPRLFLLAEGDAVLQIHHDAVHTQADGLFDLAHQLPGINSIARRRGCFDVSMVICSRRLVRNG